MALDPSNSSNLVQLALKLTWTGFNAQRAGWSERSVKELGGDVKRVDEVGQ